MDYQKVLTGFLSKTLKIDDGQLAEILNGEGITEDTAVEQLLAKDVARIDGFKNGSQEKFQEGYKKAKKEERTAFEDEIKKAYDFDGDTTGVDLIKAIVTKSIPAGGSKGTVTDEDVKKHPVYADMVASFSNQKTQLEKEWDEKYKQLEHTHKKSSKIGGVKSKALSFLETNKAVLPKNETAAKNLKDTYAAIFDSFDYDERDGKTIVLNGEGEVLQDKHGYAITLDDFIKDKAGSFFDFQTGNGGSNGANGGSDGGADGGAGGSGKNLQPKNLEELTKITNDPDLDKEAKYAAIEYYDKNYGGK